MSIHGGFPFNFNVGPEEETLSTQSIDSLWKNSWITELEKIYFASFRLHGCIIFPIGGAGGEALN